MKTYLFIIAAFALLTTGFISPTPSVTEPEGDEQVWHTDLSEAVKISNETGKPLFAFFTGSDWCGWCKRLQANVFYKPEFKAWAKDNVVLLELDFPRRTQLPADLARQNNELRNALQVTGYPTIWVILPTYNPEKNNINLNPLGKLGYPRGGEPGKEQLKFLEDAKAVMAKMPTK